MIVSDFATRIVTGRFVTVGGLPAAGHELRFTLLGSNPLRRAPDTAVQRFGGTVTTDAAGEFEIELVTGMYNVSGLGQDVNLTIDAGEPITIMQLLADGGF